MPFLASYCRLCHLLIDGLAFGGGLLAGSASDSVCVIPADAVSCCWKLEVGYLFAVELLRVEGLGCLS